MSDTPRQLARLNALLRVIWNGNPFYKTRWIEAGLTPGDLASLDGLAKFPSLRKTDLLADRAAHPPFGCNFTFDPATFTRIHRSGGTTGRPMLWLDDNASWQALIRCSIAAFRVAGVSPSDRLFLSARFGSSFGPWLLLASALELGCQSLAPGEIPVTEELKLMCEMRPSILVGKPGKILFLALVAKAGGHEPRNFGVRKIVTVSESGGSDKNIRSRIESAWSAECFDRYGMTEAGTIAAGCVEHPGGLHILDQDILAEVLRPEEDIRVPDGMEGELVLTHLGRVGMPIVRYRTGDRACLRRRSHCMCGLHASTLVSSISRMVGIPSTCPSNLA